uniref:Uncharacterized protein n=1 Tax=Macaca nemestrina TaxID=9545 RepID=A0A2K6B669_MACNE
MKLTHMQGPFQMSGKAVVSFGENVMHGSLTFCLVDSNPFSIRNELEPSSFSFRFYSSSWEQPSTLHCFLQLCRAGFGTSGFGF